MKRRDPLRLALVGCGRMGRAHLSAIADVADLRLDAVVDPAVDPAPYRHASLDEVLGAPGIDGLVIAAPTPAHESLVRAALEAGKHVLCEKPLTLDPAADLALGRLAAARARVLQIGFWRRFAEPYRVLRDHLTQDRLGEIRAARAAQWDARPPTPAFCDPRVSGGLEIDCGVHEFDLVRWLLGAEVVAVAAHSPLPSEPLAAVSDVDTVHGVARLTKARSMTIDLTRTAGYRDSIRTEIVGDGGSAIVEFDDAGVVIVRHADQREVIPLAPDPIAGALRGQLLAFVDAVRHGRASRDAATAADSRRALLAARALRDARRHGTWRRVEP